jgi:DNA-binding MarR family transcriptional regulator
MEPIPLDNQLCFALYGASMAVGRAYKPLLDQMGITYPQFLVLSALWEADGATIGAIAQRLDLEPSTITPLVKRLEAAGFVTRERNREDERQVHARLTPKGWAMRQETTCLAETLLRKSGLDVGQVQTLNTAIRRLRDAVAGAA